MPFTYVIPDLHGRRDLLDLALGRILEREPGTIVALGDFVDKGPDARGVIARMRDGVPPPWRMIPLKGNHDAMMVAALRGELAMEAWLTRGGDAVLRSYGGEAACVPQDDIAWLDALALMHEDAHRVYVHAGVDPELALPAQGAVTLMNKRYADDDAGGHGAGRCRRFVVHGHDTRADGPILRSGRINLDTTAWRTGRLVIGVFDDGTPGGPIELIEVRGPAA